MLKQMYSIIEQYMLKCMNDSAHDCQHIYRVLYSVLDIANDFKEADMDVLIAASLLHDIGRDAQFRDPKCDHAVVGADMAFEFLESIGWDENKANHVKACIASHRYRSNNPPMSTEARILFDADKLDASGTLGIARTLAYNGIVSKPLYSVDNHGNVLAGDKEESPSFFKEYHWKLKKVYDKFYTDRAREIAESRRNSSLLFYENMFREVQSTHQIGIRLLKRSVNEE